MLKITFFKIAPYKWYFNCTINSFKDLRLLLIFTYYIYICFKVSILKEIGNSPTS